MWYAISKRGLFYIAEHWVNANLLYQVYKDHTWRGIVIDTKTKKRYEVISMVVDGRVKVADTEIESGNILIDEKVVDV